MIAVIKNIRMFVVNSILRGGQTRQISAGIFYTLLIIYYTVSTPVYSCNGYTAHRVKGNGKAKPFFIFATIGQNLSVMPFTEKICSEVKYSNLATTDDARQAFQERFPLVRKLKVKHRKYYYFAHAVYGERKLFCHAYKSWEALIARFEVEYCQKVLTSNLI